MATCYEVCLSICKDNTMIHEALIVRCMHALNISGFKKNVNGSVTTLNNLSMLKEYVATKPASKKLYSIAGSCVLAG